MSDSRTLFCSRFRVPRSWLFSRPRLRVGENPMRRNQQIFGDEIRLLPPVLPLVSMLAQPVSREHQEALGPDRMGRNRRR